MKAFSERNPIAIAIGGITVIAAIAVVTFYSTEIPGLGGGGDTYAANFGDAGALKEGDDVRVAGVKVGDITSVELVKKHVRVEFRVKDAWIGDQSTAAIKIKTLLGEEYIDIAPEGSKAQSQSQPIPRSRTTTPLDVSAALSGLSETTGQIDTTQLAKGFDTLSSAFQNSPASVRSALDGLSRLSRTIASRDEQIRKLATNTNQITGTLKDSNANFAKLISDGDLLLQELQRRSAAITGLLTGTRDLARQLQGFVRDNDETLQPALQQLGKVADILVANKGNLDKGLKLLGPYYSTLTDTTGNGRWVDIYICGLFDSSNAPILDADNGGRPRNCNPGGN